MLLEPNQQWALHHGDCIERMGEMPAESIDFAVFSPPFPAFIRLHVDGRGHRQFRGFEG